LKEIGGGGARNRVRERKEETLHKVSGNRTSTFFQGG